MFYVGALLSIYSVPPFKIHPTAMLTVTIDNTETKLLYCKKQGILQI